MKKQLPKEISSKLRSAAGRVRRIVLVRGLCATVAVFTASILLVMAVDAMVVIFSPLVHWGLWLAVVAATGIAAWRTIARPLSVPLTPARIAALIEANHPELEERLSSVVELLGTDGGQEASARLMEVLTEDAVRDVGKVSVRKDFTARTVKPRLVAAGIAVAIVVALVAAFPKAMSRLLIRAVVPTAEVDNVYASALKVTPGDAVILEGTPFTVQLAVESGFPSRAYVRTRACGSGSETSERMTQTSADGGGGPTYYSFSYPLVRGSFTYRVHCGSALTRDFRVRAVAAPAYTNLEVKLEYPAYTKRAPETVRAPAPTAISTVAGTKVEISAEPNRTDLKAELLLPGGRTMAPTAEDGGRFSFGFGLEDMSGQWGLRLSDDNGFSNTVEYAAIEVVKDAAPEARLVNPKELSMELPTFGAVPFEYTARDDFGFTSVRVEMTGENGEYSEAMKLEPVETERGLWTGAATLELSRFDFGRRNSVRFRIAAADNYPEELGGPHVAYSETMSVRLVKNATSLEGKALAQQIKEADLTLAEVVKKLNYAKKSAEESSKNFAADKKDWRNRQAFPKLDESKAALLKSEKLLGDLAGSLAETMLAAGSDVIESALNDRLAPARRFCEDIYLLDDDGERSVKAAELAVKIQETIDALVKAKADFDKAAEDAKDLQKLNELAAREKALAEMAEKGEMEPERFADAQKALLDEFNREFADKLDDPLRDEKDRVAEMQKKGEDLKARQEELQKDAAALGGDDAEAKAAAEKDLREKTKTMPSETSSEERLAELEDSLAGDIAKLAKEAEKMSGEFARSAAEDAKAATDAIRDGNRESANENMDGVKDNLDKAGEKLGEAMANLEKRSEAAQSEVSQFKDAQSEMQSAADAAREAANEAAQQPQNGQQQPQDGRQKAQQPNDAAQQAQKAAEAMRQATRQTMRQMGLSQEQQRRMQQAMDRQAGMPGQDGPENPNAKPSDEELSDHRGNGLLGGRQDPLAGFNPSELIDWFKTHSDTSADAIERALRNVPVEYRSLVKEYFDQLAKEAQK